MKKIICLFMTAFLLLSAIPVDGYSATEKSEVISFNNSSKAESEHFNLKTESADNLGWYTCYEGLTISAKKNSDLQIKRIEAVISYGGYNLGWLDATDGTKRETSDVSDGSTIHIDNIHSPTFSFITNEKGFNFNELTIYYEPLNTFSEKIAFNNQQTTESDHFRLTSKMFNQYGWYGGYRDYDTAITISAKEHGLRIKKIDAEISEYGERYGGVGVSSGTKRENTGVSDGTIVQVSKINSPTFSFSGGSECCQFKDIIIYYELIEPSFPGSIISQGYLWIVVTVVVAAVAIIIVLTFIKKKNVTTNDTDQ